MSNPPPIRRPLYNQSLDGVYGEFGSGAGVQAFYLQSAITPVQLNMVSLISDIHGSERWPVRDLFQRDVNNDRISNSLLPYLQDSERIKFFNPLTLTLLPMDTNGTTVLNKMPKVVASSSRADDGREWKCLERQRYYRVRWIAGNPQYAEIEWSDTNSRLVAIDGQHRLSALKRFLRNEKQDSHDDFMKWRIPVVIVSFRSGEERAEPPSVLEVVRSIFVYINTEAREVNEARRILLSDESVNHVCTQELLQRAHTNDSMPISRRKKERLPLLFYDWRGEDREFRQLHTPAAIKSIVEIRDWFRSYILGDDFSDEQKVALGIDPSHRLHGSLHDRRLNHHDSEELRRLIGEDLLPGLSYLLENFRPYRSYVSELRALEKKYDSDARSDLARHAFYELRFGTNYADESIKELVKDVFREITVDVATSRKKCLKRLIDLDIGMRGVVSAFSQLRSRAENPDWMCFARLFTRALNMLYDDRWLDVDKRTKKRKLLLHIAVDHTDEIVNFRLGDYRSGDVDRGLGTYLMLLVMEYGRPWPDSWNFDDWVRVREDCLDTLRGTILRGFRRQVRPELRDRFPNGGRELTAAVNARADTLAGKQVEMIESELTTIGNVTRNKTQPR